VLRGRRPRLQPDATVVIYACKALKYLLVVRSEKSGLFSCPDLYGTLHLMGMRKARNVIVVFALTCSFNICEAQLQPLSYRPVASRYSTPLDRLVMISSAPDVLHIYDASTTHDTTVSLPKTPLGLAVSPDGLHAAVTHDGLISWIDLSAASLIKTIPITGQPTTVFMSNNVRVPVGTPAGNAPVTLVIGSGAAPLGGTIAVGP
jgi:hypothetical protein